MKRSILVSFLLIGLLGFLVGGATAAYFTDNVALASTPKFQFGTVGITVQQSGESATDTINLSADTTGEAGWIIENTGSESVRLRVKVIETMKVNESEPIDITTEPAGVKTTTTIQASGPETEEKLNDIVFTDEPEVTPGVDLMPSVGWEKDDDGNYYYEHAVKEDEKVAFNLTLNIAGDWSGEYELDIEVQALQAPNTGKKWPQLI